MSPANVGDVRYVVVGSASEENPDYSGPPFAVRRETCTRAETPKVPAAWAREDEFEVEVRNPHKLAASIIAARLNSGRTCTFTEMGGSKVRKAPVLAKQCGWCLGFVQIRRVGNARAFHAKFKKMLREHSEKCWPTGLQGAL